MSDDDDVSPWRRQRRLDVQLDVIYLSDVVPALLGDLLILINALRRSF